MMLRIQITPGPPAKTFKIQGRIAGGAVRELRRVCEESLADGGHSNLVLDLTDVSFLDHDGIELIRQLRHRDVAVTNPSLFVAELLKEVIPCS